MEIKLQSNLLTQISKDSSSDNWYYMKDESMNIDVTIYINEKNKVTITGQGSKKLNSYIKGCFEEYKIQIKDFNNIKESMEILLSNIEQLSSNKISFENISISKENGIYKTFFTVYKNENDYTRKRLGYIIINSNTFEILEKSNRVNEQLEKFISAYNNYINADSNTNNEIINSEIAASSEPIQDVTTSIELTPVVTNQAQDLQTIKDKINSLDHEIDQLEDQYKLIQNNRVSLGYNLAIYKCDDIHALKLIKIDKQIKVLEQQQDQLRTEYNQLFYANYKEESILYHAKFNNCKYVIIYNNETSNKIYTNNIEEYKNKAILEDVDLIINEYIDYNKIINIEVNKPILKTIYKYDSQNKIHFTAIPHQLNYGSYKEEYTNSDGNIIQLIERGFTASNKTLYTRIINAWGDEVVYIHNDSIVNSITITKYRDNKEYYIMERTIKHYKVNTLNKDMQDILNKVLKSLSSNKQYKYDIDYIKEFMSV